MNKRNIAIILHGGAGDPHKIDKEPKETPFLKEALDQSWQILDSAGSAEKACVAALRVLEGCELFDAGYGGYPDCEGKVRLDLALMRGNGDFISLLNVSRIKYTCELAADLLVPGREQMLVWDDSMTDSLLGQPGSEKYGIVDNEEAMVAPHAHMLIEKIKRRKNSSKEKKTGTVGCVARDADGNIFAATSTGGTPLKPKGRIGDSPIIGSGLYADDKVGGFSASGHGESFIKSLVGSRVFLRVEDRLKSDPDSFESDNLLLAKIIGDELDAMKTRYSECGNGGIVFLPLSGRPSYAFNTKVFSLAWRYGESGKVFGEEIGVMLRPDQV